MEQVRKPDVTNYPGDGVGCDAGTTAVAFMPGPNQSTGTARPSFFAQEACSPKVGGRDQASRGHPFLQPDWSLVSGVYYPYYPHESGTPPRPWSSEHGLSELQAVGHPRSHDVFGSWSVRR